MKTTVSRIRRLFIELRSVDLLILTFILLLAAVETAFRSNIGGWGTRVLTAMLLASGYAAAVMVIGRSGRASGFLISCLRITLVMAASSVIYGEVGHLIHAIFPFSWDSMIHAIDLAVFGRFPTLWFESFARPWLTEIMMFAYVVYLPLLPAVAFMAYRSVGRDGMEQFLFELTLVNFLCYLAYFLIPVSGPTRALADQFSGPLDGYFFTSVTGYMAANVHLPGGAFPSAHCAASTTFLLAALRYNRKTGILLSPVVALIYISTVYGRFHYVVDAIAGILVAAAVYRFAPLLHHRFDRWVLGIAFTKEPERAFLQPAEQRGETI